MRYFQILWRVQLLGLGALLLFGVLLSLFFMLEDLAVSSTFNVKDNLLMVVGMTLFYGAVPVVLVGAPAYASFLGRGAVRWLPMVVISMLPGAFLFLLYGVLGIIAIVAGLFVLALTHLAAARWVVQPASAHAAVRIPAARVAMLCAFAFAVITAIVLASPISGSGTTGIVDNSIFRLLILTAVQAPIGIAGLVNCVLAWRQGMAWIPALVINLIIAGLTVIYYFA